MPRARRRRRDWSGLFAQALCVLFAFIGVLPIALGMVVRSAWARGWAVTETERLLREHGILASYGVELKMWPLAVELSDLTVASSDGDLPALESPRANIRPRFFALLSGRLAIDQVEVDSPAVRLVIRDGKIANLHVILPEEKSGGPFHAPFNVFTIADASLDLDVDGTLATAKEVDLDVTTDDDRERGSSFEIALRAGEATLKSSRLVYPNGPDKPPILAIDDDALCGIDARFRAEPTQIIVRRLIAAGSADLDIREGTRPRCGLPKDDKRVVEIALSHVHLRYPEKPGDMPKVDGHIKVRAPLGLAERLATLPETDGWLGIEADVRYAEDTILPELSGHIEAHGIRLDKYSFAQEIQGDVAIRNNVVTSPLTVIRVAEGTATFTKLEVDPLLKGVPLKARLDVKDVSFGALMHDLGVSPHPHVAWDVREVHMPILSGTIAPLRLDGDFTGHTQNFEVDDIAHDNPAHARVIGVKDAPVRAHLAVRPEGVHFQGAHVIAGKSTFDDGSVFIGFNNDLRIDVPKGHVDLEDITPLGSIPIAGQGDIQAHVSGTFSDPHLEADASMNGFVFGDMPFGNVTAAHGSLTGLVLDLKNVKAQKNKSTYEMPSARLDFGSNAAMLMDAQATTSSLGMRDFLSIFKMDDDPRFADIDGTLASRASLRVALGGPEDVCGGGFIDVRATAHVVDVNLFGERFDDGDLDLEYKWKDRLAGIGGADIDVRAVTLHKVHAAGARLGLGSVLGSLTIRAGGSLHGSVVLQSIMLSRLQALGSYAHEIVEGSVSGMLQVGGTIDEFAVEGDLDVTPLHVRGATLGPSHLRVGMTQDALHENGPGQPLRIPSPRPKTRCGVAIPPPFDAAAREAYLKDTSSKGNLTLDGELFGGQVRLENLTMTRQKSARVKGAVGLRRLDLGALAAIVSPPQDEPTDDSVLPPAITGEVSGNLSIDLVVDDLAHASLKFAPGALVVSRGGQKLALRATNAVIAVDDDVLTLPPLGLDLQSPGGLKGSATVRGTVSKLFEENPELGLSAELAPIDLGVFVGIVPKLERSVGMVSGSLTVKGRVKTPDIAGEMHVKGGEFAVHGWPSIVTDVDVDVRADAAEVRIERGTAKFAGGTVSVTGGAPIRGMGLGAMQAVVVAKDIHVAPSEGIATTLDADLNVTFNPSATGTATASLPHVSGDVLVTSFEYTRPINLELNAFGVRSKRTEIETYDPSLDTVAFDAVRVRTKSPLKIKNNLVEIQLRIESNALTVSGTDQRVGLRGEMRALAGGRFHLRSNEFEVRQALIRFDDPTRIVPNVDVVAVTEYRRYSDTSVGAAAGAGAGAGATAAGAARGGLWRITLHAYGDTENLRLDMTSDPPLSQEDIVLLLTIGMTRAEVDQLQAGSLGASAALEALATVSGADRAVKAAIPVIDDFRFGSAYSSRTGRTEPQVTVGKRLTDNIRANVSTGLAEDRELRSNIEWRLNQRVSVQGSYDNINDVSSSSIGNVGVDFRWRLEFE